MNATSIEAIGASSMFCEPAAVAVPNAEPRSDWFLNSRRRRTSQSLVRPASTFDEWGQLMVASQRGETHAYTQLLGELDAWLRRYYARRLPRSAVEDAKQEVLLAVHAARDRYEPTRSFGAWLIGIARHKWIDFIRQSTRDSSLLMAIPTHVASIVDQEEAILDSIELGMFLGRLSPAQAAAIRLVKLEGASVDEASRVSGQSTSLVKVNIHRGLKKIAVMIACDYANSRVRAIGRSSDQSYIVHGGRTSG